MKIYTYSLEDGRIYSVRSCEDTKMTDQELIDRVNELNEKEGREAYKLFDVPEGMEEVFRFFFGEKKYKRYADMDDIDNSINDLGENVKDAYYTISDLMEGFNWMKEEFKKFKENLQNEN